LLTGKENMSWGFSMLLTRNLGRSNNAIALVGQLKREFLALQVGHSFQASAAHLDFQRSCGGFQYIGK